MLDKNCLVFSESDGLLELCVDLGPEVKADDSLGLGLGPFHNMERTGELPTDYHAKIDGIFSGRHSPGQIAMGDFLGVIAVPM
jgi:N-alpha-acetyl-L-2,4-diaminobutyrate deacetylase